MSLLERIQGPQDLRSLSAQQLTDLAHEIRTFLVANVSRTGGHLGPNLGVVELTIALHRVFNSPDDPIIFDTGHQSYVHKILTGRQDLFPSLRQFGGLSGYPKRSESPHDWLENSHASASLSWAEGMAKAFQMAGSERTVVAVIGDGALTGGMAWEAINNIAAQPQLPVIIVVNDNGRSYTRTVGGLAIQLSALRTDRRYEETLTLIKRTINAAPVVGRWMYAGMHAFKSGVKDALSPQGMFSDLGLKYVGPIDGHNIAALENALLHAKGFGGPVIVHCLTSKGRGFKAAEDNAEDHFHAVGRIHEVTGEPLVVSHHRTWTDVFADAMVRLGAENPRLVALTAAMLHPTGLDRFKAAYPDRLFDVGIAEQHAVASAAGMAAAGLHPVVAVYSTFLNRAFDQVLFDVGLHKAGVTFVLDRAGITGPDGPSHDGMWDLSLMNLVPGLRLAAPRDEQRLCEALQVATQTDDAPTVIRFSKDVLPEPLAALRNDHGVDVLVAGTAPRVLLVGHGYGVGVAVEAAELLDDQGVKATVVDPVWSLPVNPHLVDMTVDYELVVTVEDNGVVGGLGARLALEMAARGITTQVRVLGIPQEFVPQGSRAHLLEDYGLTPDGVAASCMAALS